MNTSDSQSPVILGFEDAKSLEMRSWEKDWRKSMTEVGVRHCLTPIQVHFGSCTANSSLFQVYVRHHRPAFRGQQSFAENCPNNSLTSLPYTHTHSIPPIPSIIHCLSIHLHCRDTTVAKDSTNALSPASESFSERARGIWCRCIRFVPMGLGMCAVTLMYSFVQADVL